MIAPEVFTAFAMAIGIQFIVISVLALAEWETRIQAIGGSSSFPRFTTQRAMHAVTGVIPVVWLSQGEIVKTPDTYIPLSSGVNNVAAEQVCLQCGKCCERWGWDQKGIVEDLIPWLEKNRTDILQHVSIRLSGGKRVSGTDITAGDLSRIVRIYYWQDPAGRKMRECPFFRRDDEGKALCGIHDVKPRVCREFTPWTWQNHEFYGNCPACREKTP